MRGCIMKRWAIAAVWTLFIAVFGSAAFGSANAQEITLEAVVPGGLASPIGAGHANGG